MQLNFQSDKPLYLQIAEELEDAIVTGAFAEEAQVPSTTEISANLHINPATVLKGMSVLVDQGILYKKRGVGMFVKEGAPDKIRSMRKDQFYETYILRMLQEARKLGLTQAELLNLIERGSKDERD